jgi:hypothetical protein
MQKVQILERVIDKTTMFLVALGMILAGATLVLGA